MSENIPQTPVRDRILEIFGIALAMTIAFHLLPGENPFGFAFAIFAILMAIAMITISLMHRSRKNTWAFLFLLPAGFGAIAHVLYASDITRVLAFLLTLGCLSLFAYWHTRPYLPYREVLSFWPRFFFLDTIWPYKSLSGQLKKMNEDKRILSIVIGIAIAIPFLFIFITLFASADKLFEKSVTDLFSNADLGTYIGKTIRDVIVGLFFLSSGLLMFARMRKQAPEQKQIQESPLNKIALATFLTMLNILFAIFVGFQAAYFFGGEAIITQYSITYADYARHGFFELLFAAGLVFAITAAIYRSTGMKHRLSAGLNVALIVQTGVIIASAISRLLLYVDAYGLTLSRFWAMFCILLIAIVLLTSAIGAIIKVEYFKMAKTIFLLALFAFSFTLVINSEAFIARYNVMRFLEGRNTNIDIPYLVYRLSIDSLPVAIDLYNAKWPYNNTDIMPDAGDTVANNRQWLLDMITQRQKSASYLIQENWLGASVAHFRALPSIPGTIK
ncbi:MAG: DUF4153 domain-containing protein [Patescibacteria group bacterium]